MVEEVKKLRKSLKLTQKEFADKLGVSQPRITEVESKGYLSDSLKEKIEQTFNVVLKSDIPQENKNLKEIAIVCGIETKLTTHSARKTFAILATERYKFSLESISYMLGHSDIKTTQAHYARVRLNTVKNELAKMTV